jgi:hypothetical protein
MPALRNGHGNSAKGLEPERVASPATSKEKAPERAGISRWRFLRVLCDLLSVISVLRLFFPG